jgi:proline iminopeptidase
VEALRVAVAGGELVGSRAGKGEPALMLHGGPGLADYMGPLAEELAPHFDIVRYQQRGLPPSLETGPYDVETSVDDAIAVLDALDLERAWLIGHSWGGHLALHVAVAVPHRVGGLVLIGAPGAYPDGGLADMLITLRARYESLYGRPFGPNVTLEEGWPLRFSDPRAAPPWPGIAFNRAVLREMIESFNQHYARRTLVNGLPHLDVPALFIHGRMDPLPVTTSEETAALMPGSNLHIIEKCGHFPWIEYPGAVGELVSRQLLKR